MKVKLCCLKCKVKYTCSQRNTKIVGPILTTTCPECGCTTTKNYSAFLDAQTDHIRRGRYILHNAKAKAMILLAQAISSIISNEEAFKKKK